MKTKRFTALALATILATTGVAGFVQAEETNNAGDGYKLVWSDEFNGTELNRNDWNVETHEPGWVNSELQAYVDSADNIYLKDGLLYLNPVESVSTSEGIKNILADSDFANGLTGWEETIANWGGECIADASSSTAAGSVTYDIKHPGTAEWHVQLKHPISVNAGKTYQVSFNVTSSVARKICAGVMNAAFAQYGQTFKDLNANELTTVTYLVNPTEDNDAATFYFSLGKINGEDTPASVITISDINVTEFPGNMLAGSDFNGNASEGTIVKEINASNMGSNPWDVQVAQSGVLIEQGETYTLSYKASSSVPRGIVVGVQKMSDDYAQYGQDYPYLTEELKEFTCDFTMKDNTDAAAGVYFNIGKNGETPESTITITDVSLVKKPGKETKVTKSYTSGRISTQNKQTFTYGKFECRAKVPTGAGYLPAFWLMANDENIYGQWPRCGEIDCMEVMGKDTTKAYGTIHYGNPHAESQGTYVTSADEKSFSDDFHTFTCEWEPGKITWYVDGKKYHEESSWYSTTENQGTLSYPAPFDQPFYVILNLAVGGSWVGNPDENTSFDNNPYVIDYVRVYQKDSYDENVEKPVKEVEVREPNADGNYINNGNFAVAEDLTDDADWKFMTQMEGEASASISNNEMLIETTKEGTVDYAVQLVQANVPFVKGAQYEVKFDAYASADREIGVDVKAPDHGYITYMPSQSAKLTTEKQTFTYTFKMKSDTDANGRLEYNMGSKGSTADIHISNVSIKKIADPDPNEKEEKVVLANGNYIYNGKFQEGKNHLGYWTIEGATENVSVTGFSDGRKFKTVLSDGQTLTLSQDDLTFQEGSPYTFEADIFTDKDTVVDVTIGGNTKKLAVKKGQTSYSISLPSSTKYSDKNIAIKFTGAGTYYIDNVSLMESALIKNGSFNNGLTGYEVYVDSSASAEYVVDSLKEDNALDVTVKNVSDQDWKIQVKQNNVPLVNGKTYKLTFKAKSTIDRQIRVIMQGNEAHGWAVYSNDNTVDLTNEYKTFTDTFTMNADTDKEAFLSICLAKVGDADLSAQHRVVIDDISLEEIVSESDSSDETDKKDDDSTVSGNTSGSTSNVPAATTPSAATPAATTPVVSTQAITTPAANLPATTPTRKPAKTTTKVEATEEAEEEEAEDVEEVEEPAEDAAEEEIAPEEVPLANEDEEIVVPEKKVNFIVAFFTAIKNFFVNLFSKIFN